MTSYTQSSILPEFWSSPRCPHCGVNKPNLKKLNEYITLNERGQGKAAWGTFFCAHCGNMVMIQAEVHMDGHRLLFKPDTVLYYPQGRSVSDSIPLRARTYLTQALETLAQPDASVMTTASAVDAMLKANLLVEGSLHARICKAVDDRLITQSMADWAHEVRLTANDQRHSDEKTGHATTEEASRVLEFALALAEFLFVLPATIEKGRRVIK